MDWNEVTPRLNAKLDKAHVRPPSQYGPKGDYIEGWWAIAEANRIFGFGAWSYDVPECRCVAEAPREIGQYKKPGFGVTYIARVVVMVDNVRRDDVGAGHGYDVDLGLAHESAIKEAVTDALKRALRTFGNPFGLALYDKTRANVGTPDAIPTFADAVSASIGEGLVNAVRTLTEPPHDPETGEIRIENNSAGSAIRDAWEDAIRDGLPEGYTQRQFDEARSGALAAKLAGYKTAKGLDDCWAAYWQAIGELEQGAPDLHATLLAVLNNTRLAIDTAPPKVSLTKRAGEEIVFAVGCCDTAEALDTYRDELGESDLAFALDHPKIKAAFDARRRVLSEPIILGERQVG
jgi:DNA repair and recombination protein RAD52